VRLLLLRGGTERQGARVTEHGGAGEQERSTRGRPPYFPGEAGAPSRHRRMSCVRPRGCPGFHERGKVSSVHAPWMLGRCDTTRRDTVPCALLPTVSLRSCAYSPMNSGLLFFTSTTFFNPERYCERGREGGGSGLAPALRPFPRAAVRSRERAVAPVDWKPAARDVRSCMHRRGRPFAAPAGHLSGDVRLDPPLHLHLDAELPVLLREALRRLPQPRPAVGIVYVTAVMISSDPLCPLSAQERSARSPGKGPHLMPLELPPQSQYRKTISWHCHTPLRDITSPRLPQKQPESPPKLAPPRRNGQEARSTSAPRRCQGLLSPQKRAGGSCRREGGDCALSHQLGAVSGASLAAAMFEICRRAPPRF